MEIYYHGTLWSNIDDIAKHKALLSPVELETQVRRLERLKPREREAEILRRVLKFYTGEAIEKEFADLKGTKYLRAIKERARVDLIHPYHRVANVSVTQRLEQAIDHTGEKGVIFELALRPKDVKGIYVPKKIPLERVIGILICNGENIDRMRVIELFGDYTNQVRMYQNETPNMHYFR